MKPVGLRKPDGTRPWAVAQLRQENLARSHYNLVGFQSRLKWGEQQRVFRMMPGLENAQFVRMGQVHRNTFINAPTHLDRRYRLKKAPHVRLAGQITGVEGYLESAATGLAAALYLLLERRGDAGPDLPPTTALGALARHLTESLADRFQPANINYGLFEDLPAGKIRGRDRRGLFTERAHRDLLAWMASRDFEVEEKLEPAPPVAELQPA
jgi:methylenetetrahydrofolate--tRNA-(uracil-5-)-methyltransferase